MAVATEARRIATERNRPQDVEWAIDNDGTLWILQARPMTALPPQVSWEPGAPAPSRDSSAWASGLVRRSRRCSRRGCCPRIEDRMHALFQEMLGQRAPRPYHVIVNGWYFYSINFLSGAAMLRSLPGIISHAVREPRAVAGVFPATVRHSFPIMERVWRTDVQPRYRALVAEDEARVETVPIDALPGLVDGLADAAGEYFTSIAALTGAAYKMEINLARFYQAHLRPTLGGSHLPLVAGIKPPAAPSSHAVSSLDWWYPPLGGGQGAPPATDHESVVRQREAAEAAAEAVLAESPRRLRKFRQLLADSQHLVLIREEQTAELTLPWPVMRRAVQRIGRPWPTTARWPIQMTCSS